jgi:type I restriction enzyme S subunit
MNSLPITHFADINPKSSFEHLRSADLVSFIPMADVDASGRWTLRQSRHLREVESGFTSFQDGDVLFAKITPCMENGKGTHAIGLKNGVGFGSTEFHVIRAKGANSPRFLYHWMQSTRLRHAAAVQMTGSAGQQRVPTGFFQRFLVPEVTPEQQTRIAKVLDAADEAIADAETVIKKLKMVQAGAVHDLLTRGIDDVGKLRPPASKAPELYREEGGILIPKAWDVKPLSFLFTLQAGATPSRERSEFFTNGSHAWVKTLDLNEDWITHTEEQITDRALSMTSCRLLPKGTVLIAMYGGWEQIGRTGILGITAATNQAVCGLTPLASSAVEPEFILRILQHLRPKWKGIAASTRKDPNISKADVADFLVPFPKSVVEQRSICSRLEHITSLASSTRCYLEKLRNVKAGLANDLLSENIPVSAI